MHLAQNELPAVERRKLIAAEGWLELGNWKEASDELENVSADLRAHPDVLVLRHRIYVKARKWEEAAEIANALCRMVPDEPFGWFHLAFALHELKRTREALNVLLPIADKFPQEHLIPYNLACYSCQLGDLRAAMKWLERAIDTAGKKDIRALALDDPDLEPMWDAIGEI